MRLASARPLRLAALAVSLLFFSWAIPASAAVLAGWDVHALPGGANNFGASPLATSVNDPNLTVVGLTRGSGVSTSGTAAARGWGGTDWQNTDTTTAVTNGDYATFAITPNSGFKVSFGSISKFDYRRSASGASTGTLQYQIGSGPFVDITTLNYSSTSSSGASLAAIDLTGVAALQNVHAGTTVTFRIVNFLGTASAGTWYVFDVANTTANDLEISGTVSADNAAINGVCGSANGQSFISAPTTNLCSVGAPSAVSGSGPWTWSCAGSNGGTTASCSANVSTAAPFTIYHMNDVHARLTPHKWVINQHGSAPDVFEDEGGAAYLAAEVLSLTAGNPTALVLDGGDISEGNPVGDMNCTTPQGGGTPVCSSNGFGNGGMTAFYTLLHQKLTAIGGARGSRGIDALVVGNHDVRDISYITNMEQMRNAGVPVISVNVRDIATHQPHFAATTTVTMNGHKIGIVGYTTSSATVGASLANTLEVVDCQWTGSTVCNISSYVNDLRNNQGCDIVILLTHDGHSDLVDPLTPVIADTADAKIPEIAVTGHWHTWAETVWQPASVNYKTIFTESASYMKYVGELNVDATGRYVSSVQHVLRNSDITPDPDVVNFVNNLISQYNAAHPGHPVDEIVGYTNDNLLLDNRMKWWSADEFPWNGNNSAGQWITDAMKWKCDQIAWPSGGGCDLAIEAGGGVRADIPAGPVTYLQVYETFPWADDTYVRVSLTGQDIINFINATNMDTGFSGALDVTAFDGIATSVLLNGAPIGLTTVYKVAINNYMLAHPPAGYSWPTTINAESDPANGLVRDSLSEFMRTVHSTPATAYNVGGSRYHFNGEYAGIYRVVVTMMNDADTKPTFDDAFVRFLSANTETLARRGGKQVPTSLVNADGSIVASNRFAEQELFRSFLGFKTGALVPGDILEVSGKAGFFGGDPEFVDQEGVYGDGIEFKIVGHDASLAKPTFVSSIGSLLNDDNKNHYVKFLAKKIGTSTVMDQFGRALQVWDKTGFAARTLPGNTGDTLELSGVLTMESFAFRFRSDSATVSTATLPTGAGLSSHVDAQPASTSAPISLSATASISASFVLSPVADSQVSSGNANTNSGTGTSMFIQSSSTSSFGNERAWLRFDLSSIPASTSIASATLQLWNWKSTGASLPVEARGSTIDSWGETTVTWNNQPAFGAVLDTKTLAAGATNLWYSWDVGGFVQQEFAGDKLASFVVKPVTEGSPDATAPSYGFDAKEFGSNAPMLVVTTQAGSATIANVRYFYRYSADNSAFGAWTQTGAPVTSAPYSLAFNFPNGAGYYEFYSIASDSVGNVEAAPAFAESAVHFQTASGSAQSISFGSLGSTPVGSSTALAASASSGLSVTFSSQTPSICSVSGNQVTGIVIGTCIVAADQAGDVGYFLSAPTVTRSFSVTGLSQTIAFTAPGSTPTGQTVALSASATSGLPVTFTSQTTSVCTVSGSQVTTLIVGTCTIAADQAGDGTHYLPAPTVTRSFSITGFSQVISFASIPDQVLGSPPLNVSASSTSGLTVTIVSQTTGICTISGGSGSGTVTLLAVGTCTLIASQSGDATYAPATPVTRSFAVSTTSGGGGSGSSDADAPIPLWAMILLAILLLGAAERARRARMIGNRV